MPIFAIIRETYECTTLSCARRWEKFALRDGSTREQLHFLHRCRKLRALPVSLRYQPPIKTPSAYRVAEQNGFRMLTEIINDAHNRLHR